jgi:glycosyltransferase involved in cell wall biosynthesis
VLPNEQRRKKFTSDTGRDTGIMCIWNCPTKSEVSPSRSSLNGGDLWVLYHGSLVPSRLPKTVLEALALLPEQVKLCAIGYETAGHKGYLEQLRSLATTLGISHRVEFPGTVPTREELFRRCRQADIGLAFMPQKSHDINEQAMTGASNKPFDYLACGLALLVSDLPDWRALYVDNGHALAVDPADPASIATAVRWLLEHPAELRAMGERGRQRILHEWNYEQQFAPVLQRLTKRPFPSGCS